MWLLKKNKISTPYPSSTLRFAMVSLDLVLLMIVLNPLTSWINGLFIDTELSQQMIANSDSGSQLISHMVDSQLAINIVYYNIIVGLVFGLLSWLIWQRYYTSPGKWLFGYRIVNHNDHGKLPSKRQLILRACGCLLLTPIFGINFLWCLLNKDHRTWHDVLAGTSVVKIKTK